jgi:hypothetical protein
MRKPPTQGGRYRGSVQNALQVFVLLCKLELLREIKIKSRGSLEVLKNSTFVLPYAAFNPA